MLPPRHCERSEAIQPCLRGKILDCFAALAMTENEQRARQMLGSGGKPPHSFRSYRYDFDTICQPSASFIATR